MGLLTDDRQHPLGQTNASKNRVETAMARLEAEGRFTGPFHSVRTKTETEIEDGTIDGCWRVSSNDAGQVAERD